MGYPMTWKRLINRNSLADGDYTTPPLRHSARVPTSASKGSLMDERETKIARHDELARRVNEYEVAFCMIAGDLRRLEHDAIDEDGICGYIAARTLVDKDVVAAVLKEFINW